MFTLNKLYIRKLHNVEARGTPKTESLDEKGDKVNIYTEQQKQNIKIGKFSLGKLVLGTLVTFIILFGGLFLYLYKVEVVPGIFMGKFTGRLYSYYNEDKKNQYIPLDITVDAKSFQKFGEFYYKDKDNVYIIGEGGLPFTTNAPFILEGIDPQSAEYIGGIFFIKDKNHVFQIKYTEMDRRRTLGGKLGLTSHIIEGANVSTFKIINDGLVAKDDTSLFLRVQTDEYNWLLTRHDEKGYDIQTFEYYGRIPKFQYDMYYDKNRMYFLSGFTLNVLDFDPNTFQELHIKGSLIDVIKDKNQVSIPNWKNYIRIHEADPKTFQLIAYSGGKGSQSYVCAQDKKNTYLIGYMESQSTINYSVINSFESDNLNFCIKSP